MQPNLGWIYYRDYLNNYARDEVRVDIDRNTVLVRDIDWSYLSDNDNEDVKKRNKEFIRIKNERLLKQKFSNQQHSVALLELTKNCEDTSSEDNGFILKTTYPGLLVGSGYQHEASVEGELKLGFSFDYTTGMPVIPGSSIKGVLRRAFGQVDFIREILKEGLPENYQISTEQLNQLNVAEFEEEIFGFGDIPAKRKAKAALLPLFERDIFYDAFIRSSIHKISQPAHPLCGCFLGNDFITPHKHRGPEKRAEMDPFSNPVPLQFLKILPDVECCFQFDLKDSRAFPFITRKVKKELFRQIILLLGLGAKTNVGYGQFTESTNSSNSK